MLHKRFNFLGNLKNEDKVLEWLINQKSKAYITNFFANDFNSKKLK